MRETNVFVHFVFCTLSFKIFLWKAVAGEWIDMPQFSNEKKVYRIPTANPEQYYKFRQTNIGDHLSHDYPNNIYNYDLRIDQLFNNETIREVEPLKPVDTSDVQVVTIIDDTQKDESLYTTKAYEQSTESVITKMPVVEEMFRNESLKSKDNKILEYLPVDILKNVHRILKTQPVSTSGKIQFLKKFEKTLMAEIESRLTTVVTGSRKKRGAPDHYDHGDYDHDEHSVGFPSIEGALMAISFLTFAVYLVRLVMLLFRNINNTTPTTTGATLLFGKRKRSINIFDNEAIKILSNVENFVSNL